LSFLIADLLLSACVRASFVTEELQRLTENNFCKWKKPSIGNDDYCEVTGAKIQT
jgi:hypothetical protein